MVLPRTGNANRLRPIRRLLTLALFLDVLVLLDGLLVRFGGSTVALIDVPVEAVYGPQPYVLQQLNRHLEPWTVEVSVSDPSLLQTCLGEVAHGFAFALAVLPMIVIARRLVDRAMGPEGPFTVAMAGGLHRLGVIVLVGGFLAEVVQEAAKIALYATAVHDGHPFANAGYLIDFWWLLTGFAIVGFAAIVRHGCVLRDELSEVI